MDRLHQRMAANSEAARVSSLLGSISSMSGFALDLGARDGDIARRIAPWFDRVVALDLTAPQVGAPAVMPVAANGAALPFADGAFDTVLCAEVLEDLRAGRTTCAHCGRRNLPWGHVSSFSEQTLLAMLEPLVPVAVVTRRVASRFGHATTTAQQRMSLPRGCWLHVRFLKTPPDAEDGAGVAVGQNRLVHDSKPAIPADAIRGQMN